MSGTVAQRGIHGTVAQRGMFNLYPCKENINDRRQSDLDIDRLEPKGPK